MSIPQSLSLLALRHLLAPGAIRLIGLGAGAEAANDASSLLVRHLTDHSQKLAKALRSACQHSWKALELALAGNTWWERCRALLAPADQRALSQQVQTFLQTVPLDYLQGKDAFRQVCLRELQTARKAGLLDAALDGNVLARQASEFARFADPTVLLDVQRHALGEVSGQLRAAGHANLAHLLSLQPSDQAPLLVVGMQFFFRREVESDPELARGLTFCQLQELGQAQQEGLVALVELVKHHTAQLDHWLSDIHALASATHANVLDLQVELRRQSGQIAELSQTILELLNRLGQRDREVRPRDCSSVSNEAEGRVVRELLGRYRSLPEEQRRNCPALLNAVGKLQVALGQYPAAEDSFTTVGALVEDPEAKAIAHMNAYQAALEQRQWERALADLKQANSVGGARFALFPMDRYAPLRILGAGGFGVAFLCRHAFSQAHVVIKALRDDQLGRDLDVIFAEASALERLEHPAIIRLRDCGFADLAEKARPYLVMDYFEAPTLADHVRQHGALPLPDFLAVVGQIAEGLAAAHARNVLHRDVKPANVLVRQQEGRWQSKLIDFGLAFRLQAVQETMSRVERMNTTLLGQSIAGTLDYAAPEQMGKLSRELIGPRSDIYGFARTCCYALFGTPNPGPRHWRQLSNEALSDLLADCLAEQPQDRPASMDKVLAVLHGQGARPVAEPPMAVPVLNVAVPGTTQDQPRATGPSPQGPSPLVAPMALPVTTFRFRSGALAHSLDEFVAACAESITDAEWHLAQGHVEAWLRHIGRDDLAAHVSMFHSYGLPARKAILDLLSRCGDRGKTVAQQLLAAEPSYRQQEEQRHPQADRASPEQQQQPRTPPSSNKQGAGSESSSGGAWGGASLGFVLLVLLACGLRSCKNDFKDNQKPLSERLKELKKPVYQPKTPGP